AWAPLWRRVIPYVILPLTLRPVPCGPGVFPAILPPPWAPRRIGDLPPAGACARGNVFSCRNRLGYSGVI
ncbi:hypothetical protein, partial [Gemmobacter sp.]|uniref:hypothetical protein n=1 Tax=Gemmobacter sp. TaxID=1898957 RepID=UPI0025BFD9B1